MLGSFGEPKSTRGWNEPTRLPAKQTGRIDLGPIRFQHGFERKTKEADQPESIRTDILPFEKGAKPNRTSSHCPKTCKLVCKGEPLHPDSVLGQCAGCHCGCIDRFKKTRGLSKGTNDAFWSDKADWPESICIALRKKVLRHRRWKSDSPWLVKGSMQTARIRILSRSLRIRYTPNLSCCKQHDKVTRWYKLSTALPTKTCIVLCLNKRFCSAYWTDTGYVYLDLYIFKKSIEDHVSKSIKIGFHCIRFLTWYETDFFSLPPFHIIALLLCFLFNLKCGSVLFTFFSSWHEHNQGYDHCDDHYY